MYLHLSLLGHCFVFFNRPCVAPETYESLLQNVNPDHYHPCYSLKQVQRIEETNMQFLLSFLLLYSSLLSQYILSALFLSLYPSIFPSSLLMSITVSLFLLLLRDFFVLGLYVQCLWCRRVRLLCYAKCTREKESEGKRG